MQVKHEKQSDAQSQRKQDDSLEIISWMNYNWPFKEASKDRVVFRDHSTWCDFRETETKDKFAGLSYSGSPHGRMSGVFECTQKNVSGNHRVGDFFFLFSKWFLMTLSKCSKTLLLKLQYTHKLCSDIVKMLIWIHSCPQRIKQATKKMGAWNQAPETALRECFLCFLIYFLVILVLADLPQKKGKKKILWAVNLEIAAGKRVMSITLYCIQGSKKPIVRKPLILI